MKKAVFLLLIVAMPALADDWFCTDSSSKRDSDTIYACGIGSAAEEGEARLRAFDNARAEFQNICADECKGQRIKINPGRTECEATANGYRCVRLVIFTLDSPGFFEKLFIKSQ